MVKSFDWQLVTFEDGSNPFICMDERNFKYMKTTYELVRLGKDSWLAKGIIKYTVTGSVCNKTVLAKSYKTKSSVERYAKTVKKEHPDMRLEICKVVLSLDKTSIKSKEVVKVYE